MGVCVRERERKKEKEKEREGGREMSREKLKLARPVGVFIVVKFLISHVRSAIVNGKKHFYKSPNKKLKIYIFKKNNCQFLNLFFI